MTDFDTGLGKNAANYTPLSPIDYLRRSAEVYIHYGQNEVIKNYNFVTKGRIEDLGYYKPVLSE